MNKKSGISKGAADKLVRGIERKTRKHYLAEEKIRIVLAGLRGEESIAALCRFRRWDKTADDQRHGSAPYRRSTLHGHHLSHRGTASPR